MGLETRLRETILNHADAAPTGTGLLEGVRLRQRRFQRRRLVAINVGIAVVLAVVAVPSLSGGDRQDPGLALPPLELATADYEMPYFPYQMTWMPPGAGEVEVRYNYQQGVSAAVEWEGGGVIVYVRDQPTESAGMRGDHETETVVNGHPAKQLVGPFPVSGQRVELSWQQDGRWLVVWATGSVTAAEAKRVAESLRPGRIEVRSLIGLRLAPVGWMVGSVGGSTVVDTTGPTAVVSRVYELCVTKPETRHDDLTFICVDMDERQSWFSPVEDPKARKITVNGNEGWLVPNDIAGPSVMFHIGKWSLYIEHGEGPRLTDDDMVRFAEGISIVEP